MRISIFGLGYVGAVSLACLARDGHSVIGVDIDPAKLELIRSGKTPVVEEGMVELMAQVAGSGRVSVTTEGADSLQLRWEGVYTLTNLIALLKMRKLGRLNKR